MRLKTAALIAISAIAAAGCSKGRSGVYASGTVEAREVILSARVGGEIKAIHIKRSQKLKTGEPVMDIDPELYQLKLKEAEAAQEMARQTLLKAERGLRPKEISAAYSQVRAARAQYNLAKETLDRQQALIERDAISQQDLDVAESKYKLAKAQLSAASAQYGLAKEGAREEDVETARKAVERAEAAVDAARLQLDYASVKCPADLTVSEIYVEEGELAAPGTALALLQDMTDFYIDLFVPIQRIAEVNAGDPVEIVVEGYPGKTFKGKVERVNPRAEFTPENVSTEEGRSHLVFKVRVAVDNPEGVLKPGLPADAWIKPSGRTETGGA